MMVTEAIEICRWIVLHDKTYFIDVNLLVFLHTMKYSLMSGCITYIMHFTYTRRLQSIVLDARARNQDLTSQRTV